jgi:hypothetical protein
VLLALPDYPQNVQVAAHFREFLRGYRSSAEAVQCKFPVVDGSRVVHPHSVGISDGFNKILIMVGITMICHHLDPWSCIGIANFDHLIPTKNAEIAHHKYIYIFFLNLFQGRHNPFHICGLQ